MPGVANLLENCVNIQAGDRLLIVEEPATGSPYDSSLTRLVTRHALDLGASVITEAPALVSTPAQFPRSVSLIMDEVEHTLFLSRIGDLARFTALPGRGSKTICYAREESMFRSPYAASCHRLLSTLLQRLEEELKQAESWRIRCALGTDISGNFRYRGNDNNSAFTMSLFPVTTFNPVTCESAEGGVALSRWLMPGGAAGVGPEILPFRGVVYAHVDHGRITQFEGAQDAVKRIEDYYDLISGTLGATRNRVHSWHVGINPHTSFSGTIEDDFDAWCALSFASPRYLHFHTCGDVAPCEIAWSVFNPTIAIDDQIYWLNGDFCWLHREDIRKIIIDSGQQQLLERSADIGL